MMPFLAHRLPLGLVTVSAGRMAALQPSAPPRAFLRALPESPPMQPGVDFRFFGATSGGVGGARGDFPLRSEFFWS
jgi:hypothetical protein